jgi:hypothetical protein
MLNEQKLKSAIEKYRKHVCENLLVTTWQIEREGWAFADVLEALGDSEGASKIAMPKAEPAPAAKPEGKPEAKPSK